MRLMTCENDEIIIRDVSKVKVGKDYLIVGGKFIDCADTAMAATALLKDGYFNATDFALR